MEGWSSLISIGTRGTGAHWTGGLALIPWFWLTRISRCSTQLAVFGNLGFWKQPVLQFASQMVPRGGEDNPRA